MTYPPQGYPPAPAQQPQGQPGYPPQQQPQAAPGYGQQPQPGYPPAQPGYPPAQPAYPPAPQQNYAQQAPPAYPQPGYPQQNYGQAPVPQGPPPPKTGLSDYVDQPAMSGSALSWPVPGHRITMTVARDLDNADFPPQKDPAGTIKRFNDGRVMVVMVVPVLVQPDATHPDGHASWWVKGQSGAALKQAMSTAGAGHLNGIPENGAVIDVLFTMTKPAKNSGFNPQKIYEVTYHRPAGANGNGNGQAQVPQAVYQQPPVPELAPQPQYQPPAQPAPQVSYQPPAAYQPPPQDPAYANPYAQQAAPPPPVAYQPPAQDPAYAQQAAVPQGPPAPQAQAPAPPAPQGWTPPPGMSPENAALLGPVMNGTPVPEGQPAQ